MSVADHFLEMDRIRKVFAEAGHSGILVIDDVSTMSRGRVRRVSRPSGCGKSTLMRMVGGLDFPSSARSGFEGAAVIGPSRQRGMVFQSYSSFPWLKVLDKHPLRPGNFRAELEPGRADRIALHYLEMVGLGGFGDFYVNQISGGMRQRLATCEPCRRADVLLMDEPAGALDAQNREFLQIQLREICAKERKTVVFVTHDVEEAVFLADRIFVFSARPTTISWRRSWCAIFCPQIAISLCGSRRSSSSCAIVSLQERSQMLRSEQIGLGAAQAG